MAGPSWLGHSPPTVSVQVRRALGGPFSPTRWRNVRTSLGSRLAEAALGRRGKMGRGGKGKGGYWEGGEEQAELPSPPPPMRRASSAAAAKVADFCGHINAFMSHGFRTVMVVGLCFHGTDCVSRQEDHQYGGSGKAKQIPVYLGPDEENYCAPCWEDMMVEVRAAKRTALNRKKAGKPPYRESQSPDPVEGAGTYTHYTDDRGTWRLEGASSSVAEAGGWEENTAGWDQSWEGEEGGQGPKPSRRWEAIAERQRRLRPQQPQRHAEKWLTSQERREDEITEGWRRGAASAELRSRREREDEDEEEEDSRLRSRREREDEDEEEEDSRWKKTRRGTRGGKKGAGGAPGAVGCFNCGGPHFKRDCWREKGHRW